VHTAEREGIHTWLETFAAQYPGNRWVASSRIVGYRSFALPGGSELALRPFSDEQVQRYVRGFCRAYVAWESNGVDEPETAERTAAQLLDALAAKPKLKSLTRNPFLLSGMALIHRAEGRVPGHRIQFYEMFCRCLCETWGTARRMVAESAGGAPDRLGYEGEALPILGGLAYRMHQDHPAGRAPREYVTGVLASVLQEKRSVPPEEGGRAAEEFLRRAAEGVQIFLERGPDEWGFLHLTFQEFFAAAGLHAEERFAREALKHLFEPRWEEVIRLGVGYMALVQNRPEEARRFVHRVRRYRDKRRPWITDVLRLQVPLAALLAAEAGEALPPAEQREMAEEFAEWVLRGLPWTGMTTRVLNEISLTGFRDTAAEPYLASLDAAEAPIRARAVQALGLLKGEKAGHSLLAALKDEDPGVRRSVAEALGWLKSEAALEALSAALKDEDASVRGSAAQALGELKSERALQPLLDALKDEDFLVERHAMEALGELEGGAALQRFLAALRDPDTEVRRSAAQVLGELRKENAVPPLVDALRDEDRGVRWLAAEALGRLGSAGAVQPLIAALQSGDDTVRWAAGGALGRIGAEAAIQPLLASLGDVDASVRAGAAGALGEMRSGAAIQPLVAALEDPSGFVRWQAAGALGKLRSVAATQPLVAALQDEDADVRFHAAMALADLGSPNALEPLVAALRGSDRDTRWQAAMALGRLKDIEAVEPLTTALQDSDGFVGFIAAEALGRLKGEAAVQPLLAALQTGTDPVRSGAAAALIALSQLPLGPTKRQAVGRRAMRRAAPKRRRRPAGQQDSAARTP
jgi:HEAT repeat protein